MVSRVVFTGIANRNVLVMEVKNWSKQISQGAVLLCVNQRLARHHSVHYQQWQLEKGSVCWETPDILPLRSWIAQLHRQAVAMGLSDVSLVPALKVQQAWQRIVESDNTLHLLDSAGAARSALKAWQLSCVWNCKNPEDQYLSADQFAWQRWLQRYLDWLGERQGIDEAMLPDELVRVFDIATEAQSAQLLPQTLIVDGVLQLPAQLQMLMDKLQQCGVDVHIHSTEPCAHIHRITYPDDDTELLSIATQMRAELEHDPQRSLGLVVPDLQQRRAEVVRAFERVFYPALSPSQVRAQPQVYEISLGLPLAAQPVIATALLLLQLTANSIGSNDLTHLLLSPHWLAAQTEARRREQLDRRLREKRTREMTLETFSTVLYSGSQLKPKIKKLLVKRQLRAANLTEWASRFSNWLSELGWPGKSPDSEEYQAVSAWLECLDDMQLLDDGPKVSFSTAAGQLQLLARERVFQPETPATPIQVMGRLESHALAFDCLWVAGLDSDQWPPAGSPSAFLSISEQKARGVPDSSAAERLALAEKEFALWASQTPLLAVSSAASREGNELAAAALPAVTAHHDVQPGVEQMLGRIQQVQVAKAPLQIISSALKCVNREDAHGPGLPPGTKVDGGARLFENQALCPFRAFATHRLKIRPLEEVGPGLDPRQHGTLLHTALEIFWDEVRTHDALMSLAASGLDEKLADVVAQAIEQSDVPQRLQALETRRLQPLLHEWLIKCEAPRQPFEVLKLEQKLRIEHGDIEMDVVIDRIDSADGELLVIDYKTGVNNRVNSWADARISNPQLPLYVLTDKAIEGASFAQVAVNQTRFIGIASSESVLPGVAVKLRRHTSNADYDAPLENWQAWREHWGSSLDAIAAEIKQGVATVTPMKNACTYCLLPSLCRIDSEQGRADDEDESTGDAGGGTSNSANDLNDASGAAR